MRNGNRRPRIDGPEKCFREGWIRTPSTHSVQKACLPYPGRGCKTVIFHGAHNHSVSFGFDIHFPFDVRTTSLSPLPNIPGYSFLLPLGFCFSLELSFPITSRILLVYYLEQSSSLSSQRLSVVIQLGSSFCNQNLISALPSHKCHHSKINVTDFSEHEGAAATAVWFGVFKIAMVLYLLVQLMFYKLPWERDGKTLKAQGGKQSTNLKLGLSSHHGSTICCITYMQG